VAHVWRRSWKRKSFRTLACLDALEGAVTQVEGAEGTSDLVVILPESGQAHPLFELTIAMILEGGHCWPGEAHAPALAGLGTRADDAPAPVLSASERAPHEEGGLGRLEIHLFPTQRSEPGTSYGNSILNDPPYLVVACNLCARPV
jgi:hypothetical protein